MAKIPGFNGLLRVSEDGGALFSDVSKITSGGINIEVNTEDEGTWDSGGFAEETPTTNNATIDIEGLYDPENNGQSILESGAIKKEPIFFIFYRNKFDTTKYYRGQAYVGGFEASGDKSAKVTYSTTLNIIGKTLERIKA